jgi:hypothetical protein
VLRRKEGAKNAKTGIKKTQKLSSLGAATDAVPAANALIWAKNIFYSGELTSGSA